MECPKCGGPVYDNRQKKASGQYKPTASDFACKDKDGCGWAKFPPKGQQAASPVTPGPTAVDFRPVSRPLGPLYNECITFAKGASKFHFGETATPADVIAMAATLFIQASRDGGTIRPPKAVEPPPPPPPPVPQHQPQYPEPLPWE